MYLTVMVCVRGVRMYIVTYVGRYVHACMNACSNLCAHECVLKTSLCEIDVWRLDPLLL